MTGDGVADAPPRTFLVDPPARVLEGGPDPRLGRLGDLLSWWAAAQGGWPPRAPQAVRTVTDGTGPGAAGTVEAGAQLADTLADGGSDLLLLSCSDDDTAGIVVVAALLDLEPVVAVGTVPAPDWTERLVAVRRGLAACRSHLGEPRALLEAAGGPGLARTAGVLAQAAVRRTPVLLDGSATAAGAALVAERLAPGARAWWLAGQAPVVPAAARALADLDLKPLLDLGLSLPAADLTRQLLVSAVGMQDRLGPVGPAGLSARATARTADGPP